MSVSKIDLAPWGFAPGDTYIFCVDCPDGAPTLGHRFSIRCVEHALKARLDDIRASEGQQIEEDDDIDDDVPFGQNPIEIAIRQHEQRLVTCRDIFVIGLALFALWAIYWIATS
jgi:hypothetical protein